MKNILTQGTEILPGLLYPANEDRAVVVQVTAVSGGLVSAVRVWDEGNREFFAQLLGAEPDVGSYVVFHRVGDFASQGIDVFELHEENAAGASWACFGKSPSVIFVLDLGEGNGCRVEFAADGTYTQVPDSTLPLETIEPLANYHDSLPPYQAGRIYPALAGDGVYHVASPGLGPREDILMVRATIGPDDYDLNFELDSSGKLLDFYAWLFESGYYVQPDITQNTVGTVSDYFVGQEFYAPGDPHTPGANWWKARFYWNYDSGTYEYSNFIYELDETQTEWGGTDPFYNNYFWGYRAGTGIANKTSFYPPGYSGWYSSGITTPGAEDVPEGFCQALENNTILGQDITRSSRFYTSTDQDIFPKWNLSIASRTFQRRYYDPTTDTPSDTRTAGNIGYGSLDSGGVGVSAGNAHRGFNDEADHFFVYCDATNWPSGKQQTFLPGWPDGPQDAVIYVSAKYVTGHDFTGGRVYFVRDSYSIFVHLSGSGWVALANVPGYDPTRTVYSTTAYVAEFWGDWRRRGRSLSTYIIWVAGTYEP